MRSRPDIIYFMDAAASPGGNEKYLQMLAEEARRRSLNVRVALPPSPNLIGFSADLQSEGIPVDIVYSRPIRKAVFPSVLNACKYFRQFRPRIVHFCLHHVESCRYVIPVARLLNSIVIITNNLIIPGLAPRFRLGVFLKRLNHKLCRVSICDSQNNLYILRDEWKLSSRKLSVIYLGTKAATRPDPVVLQKLRKEWDLSSGDFVITAIGRMESEKGMEYLLKAFPEVLRNKTARLLLIGDGSLRTNLEMLAANLGITRRLLFTGFRADLPEIFALSDVVAIPSLNEGMPFLMLEAMAARKSIVATQVGGIPEALTHEHNALLVSPRNTQELAFALCRLAGDPALRSRLEMRAYETWYQRFRIERTLDETFKYYGISDNFSIEK